MIIVFVDLLPLCYNGTSVCGVDQTTCDYRVNPDRQSFLTVHDGTEPHIHLASPRLVSHLAIPT
jgi:hypothetical protein